MQITIIKLIMFCFQGHFLADFTLQGCLAQMKQKQWWIDEIRKYNEQHKNKLPYMFYHKDWNCALLCHALYWTIITFLPIMLFTNASDYFILWLIITNTLIHAAIDDAKCNACQLNLIHDQCCHAIQIIVSVLVTCTFFSLI